MPANLSLPDLHKIALTNASVADRGQALRSAAQQCVGFYSAKLAVSDDGAEPVAEAVAALCDDVIRWADAETGRQAAMPSDEESLRPYISEARAQIVESRACFKRGRGWLEGTPFGDELNKAAG